MNKFSYLLVACMVLILGITSCQNELLSEEQPQSTNSQVDFAGLNFMTSDDVSADCVTTKTLIAGQHIDAGEVNVWNDDENLYVEYQLTEGWYLKETHVYAGDCNEIPLTKKGNPKIGHFPYNMEFNEPYPKTHVEVISLADLEECFCIVAHAAIARMTDDGEEVEETAFADGDMEFPGNRWGTYFEYCEVECNPDPDPTCETAFVGPFYNVNGGRCFLDDGFSRWGWMPSNFSRYSYENNGINYPLYAAAAGCSNTRDNAVGTVGTGYDADTDEAIFIVDMFDGYSLNKVHIYVGNFTSFSGQDDYPRNAAGNPTVAPGQYGNTFEDLGAMTEGEFRVSLADFPASTVWIFHAEVCGDFE